MPVDTPHSRRYKLNVDGSARDGDITGGGVIRDADGNMVAGFSYFYGQGTIMRAEYLALLDGLSMCHSMEIWELDIESDSKVVVTSIVDKATTSWAYIHTLRRCCTSWRDSFQISHIFREANRVADRCADATHGHKTRVEYYKERDLPDSILRALRRI